MMVMVCLGQRAQELLVRVRGGIPVLFNFPFWHVKLFHVSFLPLAEGIQQHARPSHALS